MYKYLKQISVMFFALISTLLFGQNGNITLSVKFDNDRHILRADAMQMLDEIIDTLSIESVVKITVVGHTDNIGDRLYNIRLSEKRALVVKNYLTARGFDSEIINTNYFGMEKPIASNESSVGRQINRRADIVFQRDNSVQSVDEKGLTDAINEIVPPKIFENLIDLGLVINGGNNPPSIEGTYLAAGVIKVKANFPESDEPTTFDEEVTFYNQNNNDLTIQMDSRRFNMNGFKDNTDKTITGIGSFIVGYDNFFSIFMKSVIHDVYGHTVENVEVISGELVDGGIRNLQSAYIRVEDNGDPRDMYIEIGQGRLYKDPDGFSERINK